MMTQEFQHSEEFELTQVMTHKMQMIQFELIGNLNEMRLMIINHNMRNMMIQEFQYTVECQYLTMMRNYESIDDQQYQQEHFHQSQSSDDLFQLTH
jgi:hypothetical protein